MICSILAFVVLEASIALLNAGWNPALLTLVEASCLIGLGFIDYFIVSEVMVLALKLEIEEERIRKEIEEEVRKGWTTTN